jgi:hypothetical protein
MAITSVGFKGTVGETQWARLSTLMGQGACLEKVGDCTITQVAGQRQVSVSTGSIFGDGVLSTLSSAEVVTVPPPTNGQWFLLVLNRVWSTKVSSFVIRNSNTTATASSGKVPTSYPATLKTGVGAESDTPVAWLWGNSTGTAVVVVPILRAPSSVQPRRRPATQPSGLSRVCAGRTPTRAVTRRTSAGSTRR